jgi:hypothetical protein
MNILLEKEGALSFILARFTQHDAKRRLGVVSWAFYEACNWDHVTWVPFGSLEAALERLAERYALGPTMRYYECVEAFTHTLFALELGGTVQFLPGNPAHTDCTILGMHSIHVLDTAAWIQELLAVVRTHPAFQHPLAGPYAYDAEDPAWAAYVVLLDFGLRPVLSSSIPTPPTVPPMRHWIHYAEWEYRQVGIIEHQDHLRNLARLRAAALAPEAAEAGAALRDT